MFQRCLLDLSRSELSIPSSSRNCLHPLTTWSEVLSGIRRYSGLTEPVQGPKISSWYVMVPGCCCPACRGLCSPPCICLPRPSPPTHQQTGQANQAGKQADSIAWNVISLSGLQRVIDTQTKVWIIGYRTEQRFHWKALLKNSVGMKKPDFSEHFNKPQPKLQSAKSVTCATDADLRKRGKNALWKAANRPRTFKTYQLGKAIKKCKRNTLNVSISSKLDPGVIWEAAQLPAAFKTDHHIRVWWKKLMFLHFHTIYGASKTLLIQFNVVNN